MSIITKSYFFKHVGRYPEQDDLIRCNCQKQGEAGHWQCGWNFDKQKPVFLADVPDTCNIKCVAHEYTRDNDTVILWAPRPFRHGDIYYQRGSFISSLRNDGYKETQGFLTNRGLFVDRHQALVIADKAKQILSKTQPSYKLFSEDMW